MAEPNRQQFQSVRRKKRRQAAWIVFGLSGTGVTILSLIAFLGQISGTFTINLNQVEAHLGLSFEQYFQDPTSILKTPGLPSGYNYSCDNLPALDVLDDNTGGDKSSNILNQDGSILYQNYMGATFFLKNFSTETTAYHVSLNIDDYRTPANQTASLLESLRVRVFENVLSDTGETHAFETYALQASASHWFTKNDGTQETRECIGHATTALDGTRVPAAEKAENNDFATNFLSTSVVFSRDFTKLDSLLEVRYSIFIWVEGDDPECITVQPKNATVTLSMHFATI